MISASSSKFLFKFISFQLSNRNTVTASVATRKMTVSLADSTDLRIILSILYIITEVIWAEKQDANSEYKDHVESFCNELSECFFLVPFAHTTSFDLDDKILNKLQIYR